MAAASLAEAGVREALSPLRGLAQDPDVEVRKTAARAVALLDALPQ